MSQLPFDVFLSHNSEDKDLAEQLAHELREAGLKVWFDKWELRPGVPWLEGLEKAVKESASTAVLVGPSGMGPWERAEVRAALQEHVNRGCPVIPVVLPGVAKPPELPGFLAQHTWVDCRRQQTSQDSLNRLIWGITGKRPSTSVAQMGEEFFLTLERPDKVQRSIKVYTLPNADTDRLLHLTWVTLGQGIENLRDQIRNYGTHPDFDACFGINDAGLVIATFLNSAVMGRAKIGYVRHKGTFEGRVIVEEASVFPELPPKPTVMLIDFEVKSGSGLRVAVERVRHEYGKPKIYYAAFGALTGAEVIKIKSFDELAAAENLLQLGIEDFFIACTMHPPGIEPPLGLR